MAISQMYATSNMNAFRRSATSAVSWVMLKSTAKLTTTCRQTRSHGNGMTPFV
ncbi:hypothetical protein LINGRAHAP2_LOCUS2149 [Linum grandiflorum]